MSQPRWLSAVIGAVLALAGGLAFGAILFGGRHEHTPSAGSTPIARSTPSAPPTASTPLSEREFLQLVADHHRVVEELAELAAARLRRPAVREIAAEMRVHHRRELSGLIALHQVVVGGRRLRPRPIVDEQPADGRGTVLTELASARAPDRLFLELVLAEHAGAILLARSATTGDARPRVARLAAEVIAGSSAEIGRLGALEPLRDPPAP